MHEKRVVAAWQFNNTLLPFPLLLGLWQVTRTKIERDILSHVRSPFIVGLQFAFQVHPPCADPPLPVVLMGQWLPPPVLLPFRLPISCTW